jgi:hypothetical protein
MFKATEINR